MNVAVLALLGGLMLLSPAVNGITGTRLKKSAWFAPYSESSTGTLRPTMFGNWTGKAGVYWIKEDTGRIIYVGSSTSQLKKTIYRHFQTWTDRQRSSNRQFDRVTYSKQGYKVRFVVCSPADALRAEKYFIRKLKPRDNPTKYNQLSFDDVERIEKSADKLQEAEAIDDVETPW